MDKATKDQIRNLIADGKTGKALDSFIEWANTSGSDMVNDLIGLKAQWASLKRNESLGLIGFSEVATKRSQIANGVLQMLESLDDVQATVINQKSPDTVANSTAYATTRSPNNVEIKKTIGGILYNIPNKMQLNVQTKCIVRLAFDKNLLKNENDALSNEVITDVKVSDVMEIDLIDMSMDSAFNILFISQKVQKIDKNEATEWQIMVKALKMGKYTLALKVAIITRVDGVDRSKETVLDQTVEVISSNVVPSTELNPLEISSILPASYFTTILVKGTILFMGANPPGTSYLQLEVEHSRIATKLDNKFKLCTEKFLSVGEIPELISKYNPNIIHFSGHGKEPVTGDSGITTDTSRGIGYALPKDYDQQGGILVFDDDMRGMRIIDDESLAYLFDATVNDLKVPLQVVVFNSCYSESQAKAIGKFVPYVVGSAYALDDDLALAFAEGFYFGISNDNPIERAFVMGKMNVLLRKPKAKDLIVLYKQGVKMDL